MPLLSHHRVPSPSSLPPPPFYIWLKWLYRLSLGLGENLSEGKLGDSKVSSHIWLLLLRGGPTGIIGFHSDRLYPQPSGGLYSHTPCITSSPQPKQQQQSVYLSPEQHGNPFGLIYGFCHTHSFSFPRVCRGCLFPVTTYSLLAS